MSLPLKRSEEPLNRSEELRETLTTADLAQPKRPASAMEELGPKPVRSERVETPASTPTESTENASLFSAHELDDLRNRWNTVQTGFLPQTSMNRWSWHSSQPKFLPRNDRNSRSSGIEGTTSRPRTCVSRFNIIVRSFSGYCLSRNVERRIHDFASRPAREFADVPIRGGTI